MILYLLNHNEKIEASLNTDVYGINLNSKIAEGDDDTGRLSKVWSETLSFQVPSINATAALLETGKKVVAVMEDGQMKMFTIYAKSEETKGNIHLTSIEAFNSAIWELYKTVSREDYEWASPAPHLVFQNIFNNTTWTIQSIDLPYQSYDGSFSISRGSSKQSSIDEALTLFKCEIEAWVEIDPNTNEFLKYVRIVEKLGENKRLRFEYRHNITGLSRHQLDTDFFTRLYVYGGTAEGADEPTTLAPVNNGVEYITDYEANDKWNAGNKVVEGLITNDKITNSTALLAWAQEQMKFYNHPKFQYTVDIALFEEKPNLGDTVVVVDFEMDPVLTVEARVVEVNLGHEESVVLGEFTTVEAKAPDSLAALNAAINEVKNRVDELGNPIIQANNPPQTPQEGDLWLDTSIAPNKIYRWDGAFWVATSEAQEDQIKVQMDEPAEKTDGLLWLVENELLRWDEAVDLWLPVGRSEEEIITAVAQSEQFQNMFSAKADAVELDKYAVAEEINAELAAAEQARIDAQIITDNRIQGAYEDIGSIEAKITALPGEINASFTSNALGVNLIRNSIGFADGYRFSRTEDGTAIKTRMIDFWETQEDLAPLDKWENTSTNRIDGYGSAWTAMDGTQAQILQQVSGLNIGEKYTLSGLFKKTTTTTDHALVRLYRFDSATETYVQFGAAIGIGPNDTQGVQDFRFSKQVFEAPDTSIYIQVDIANAVEQDCEITALMLNTGATEQAWTKHSEEQYSTGIIININGIRVQSGQNYTQMTPNDFSGYVLEGIDERPRRIFSLDGDQTFTANLVAEDSIKMGLIRVSRTSKGWSFKKG